MLSRSRFDDDLRLMGLIPDLEDATSTLTLEIRNPGVDLSAGERPRTRRSEQPLTRMAASAVRGESGVDIEGYRDYRGVWVLGAWRWLPEYEFGVAVEVDRKEILAPFAILRNAFWGLVGVLLLVTLGMLAAVYLVARQQAELRKAVLRAKRLGQYTLEEKLGAGGMGTVYKARHAMLRRPTAVKLLDVERMSPAAIARFEREVQMTASLTHPNTIAVYDYGRTPEGVFYYVMEYLEGVNLDRFVRVAGRLPSNRAIHLLEQICESLAEAHARGMVHRDVKPANILLTRRGGRADFIKVLDFGLVKEVGGGRGGVNVTAAGGVTGTPLYMPPEALQRPEEVDARSDVYAIAAVGYYLLTGSPVFEGDSIVEICMKQIREAPEPPSRRIGAPIDPALEDLLLSGLAKEPGRRPSDAAAFLRELRAIRLEGGWSALDAERWWADHGGLFGGPDAEEVGGPPTRGAPGATRTRTNDGGGGADRGRDPGDTASDDAGCAGEAVSVSVSGSTSGSGSAVGRPITAALEAPHDDPDATRALDAVVAAESGGNGASGAISESDDARPIDDRRVSE